MTLRESPNANSPCSEPETVQYKNTSEKNREYDMQQRLTRVSLAE